MCKRCQARRVPSNPAATSRNTPSHAPQHARTTRRSPSRGGDADPPGSCGRARTSSGVVQGRTFDRRTRARAPAGCVAGLQGEPDPVGRLRPSRRRTTAEVARSDPSAGRRRAPDGRQPSRTVPGRTQRPGRDLSRRGRRECGMWSLSRIGRVSCSGSRPLGADHPAGSPAPTPTGVAGRADSATGPRPAAIGPAGRLMFGSAAVASETAGNRPVSAVRCRPGPPASTAGGATARRTRGVAGPAADATSSGARRRPPVGADTTSSGARRRPPGTAAAADSGARRRPPEAAGAESSGARRRPPPGVATGSSGARRRPPAEAIVESGTTDRSRTVGRLAEAVPAESTWASARCSRREDGWRATDSSRSAGRAEPGTGAIARWRSGRRRVSRPVQAVSSTPSRTTLTQTWQDPSPACRQPSSSPLHQAPAW